ncbi:FctA domain-containing protein [Ruminococcus sp. FC2018]|uniref:Spy0128 family protein n=1 Tax=Ruminococcus sp. FC2018 TaxID=1410617 RepID=UPI00048C249F|nr:FctA domain-containing protein [Ruminococcus sp. FC2018]
MIKRMLGRIVTAAIAVCIVAAIMCFPVFAAGDTCELYIPVSISDSGGKIPKGTVFTVEIKSETGAPLPEKTTLTVDVSGNCQFGPIVFDEPGNYEYTISEHKVTQDKVITDDTVYDVHILPYKITLRVQIKILPNRLAQPFAQVLCIKPCCWQGFFCLFEGYTFSYCSISQRGSQRITVQLFVHDRLGRFLCN